jgi:hypothetical protein
MKKSKFRILICVLLALCLAAAALPVFAAGGFSDVAETSWALSYIEAARDAGIVNGYSDGTFKPGKGISRQETAAMLYRTLKQCAAGFDETDYSEDFAEQIVSAGAVKSDGSLNWAAPYLAYGFRNGFLSEEDFSGASAAGVAYRSLIAKWTALAMGYELAPLCVLPYSDTSHIAPADFVYIDALYRHSIMMGNADGTFAPDHEFNRAQMAAVAVRLMGEESGALTYDMCVAHRYGTVTVVNADRRTIALDSAGRSYTLQIPESSVIMLDGAKADFSALSALNGKAATFSGVAGTDCVIVQTRPVLQTGTIESIETMKDFTLLRIMTPDGVTVCAAVRDASLVSSLYAGRTISYISDGALLLELD